MTELLKFRKEKDPLGEKEVPIDVYYGIQTVRAIKNFPISGIPPKKEFIIATAMLKKAAAIANMATGGLNKNIGKAIVRAADEIIQGRLHKEFVVDVYQAGAGTSHNMNANEIIANRAIEILGGRKGDYTLVHPNDHVNMSQSTNDIVPSSMRIASLFLTSQLITELKALEKALSGKAKEFDGIIKSARTHLQDAVPIRLGQEFHAYGKSISKAIKRIERAAEGLQELGVGATAAGTGINTHPAYRKYVIKALRDIAKIKDLRPAENMLEAINSMADFVNLSQALRGLAIELIKIANDLRLLSSGPRTGFAEMMLPTVQPGSSIMPGKVNPVMAEMLNMVSFQVIGNDLTIAMAAQAGQLELNVMMPIINYNLLQSLEIFRNAVRVFTEKCIKGIKADRARCKELAEKSIGLATVLNPFIGYEKAAAVAKEAVATGKTIREIVLEKRILSKKEIDKILDPMAMTRPRLIKK
ncbi:MAG TPA: aspartate ammonia-lyase [Thermodesulfobacteriota bacterium]|nr:aspartate ammonia-lyase [Thermodesulfobacteriota bacterium]